MAVLFQAAEFEDWALITTPLSGIFPSTDGNAFNGSNSRMGFQFQGTTEFSRYCQSHPFSSSEFWVHWRNFHYTTAQTPTKYMMIGGGGTRRISLQQTSNDSKTLSAYQWSGSAWNLIGTGITNSHPLSVGVIYDMYIKLGNPGILRIYKNSLPILAAAPDFSFGGLANMDLLEIAHAGTGSDTMFSEIVVATFNTIGCKLVTRIPDANGAYTAWTGAGYTALDELQAGVDYMTSNVADERASYSMSSFPALTGAEVIASVQITALANRDASGPQNINNFVRISTTDTHLANQTLSTTPAGKINIIETSPATSVAWTVTELNAAEYGFRSRT